jgi:TrmH family RNA methyltransferase
MKTLRSRDNAFVKQLIALAHSSRERKKVGLTVLDGIHLVGAYCHAVGMPKEVAVAESALDVPEVLAFMATVDNAHIRVLADALMADASVLGSPSSVLALVETPRASPVLPNASAVLVLEDVQDPGNVGAMLRTAAAAGVRDVVCSATTAFAWAPKVLRAGQGAHFSLNIVEGADVLAFVGTFQGQSLALAPRATQTIYACDLRRPTAWLIGNEGSGLSQALLAAASARVAIPMPGKVESLNAAATAAIALFEMVRQRGEKT